MMLGNHSPMIVTVAKKIQKTWPHDLEQSKHKVVYREHTLVSSYLYMSFFAFVRCETWCFSNLWGTKMTSSVVWIAYDSNCMMLSLPPIPCQVSAWWRDVGPEKCGKNVYNFCPPSLPPIPRGHGENHPKWKGNEYWRYVHPFSTEPWLWEEFVAG